MNTYNKLLYKIFNWKKYVSNYSDLYEIKTKNDAWLHWNKYGLYEYRTLFTINNDYSYENFDHNQYLLNYKDLSEINTKDKLWQHWCNIGITQNKIFYDIIDNTTNKQFTIINNFDISLLYYNLNINSSIFNEYKSYFINNNIKYYDNYYILENHSNYFFWINESLNKKFIYIKSPYTSKILYSDIYFILTIDMNCVHEYIIANYYFKEENIILGIGLGTGIGAMDTKILYLINFNKYNIYYNWNGYSINNFKNNIFENIIKNKEKIKLTDFSKLEKLNITIYGYHNNIGHNLFNDISGLFILDHFNINKYIDKVIMGNHDIFYINKYFEKYSNIKIDKSITDLKIMNNNIYKGIIFKYNHFFLSNKCINFLKNHLQYNFNLDLNHKNEINYIKENYYPIIHIVLRIGNDYMLNQDIIISEIINKLTIIYPKIFFYLDGLCSSSNINDNDLVGRHPYIKTFKNLKEDYINLVESINKKTNTKNYKSLIDDEAYIIIKYLEISTYSILQLSSISCLSAWICNIPGIQFGRKNIKIYEKIDSNIKENIAKIQYISDDIEFFENNYSITSDNIIKLLPNFTI
jgi:hypothetical protein